MLKINTYMLASIFLGCISYTGLTYGVDGTIIFTGELGGECSVASHTATVNFGKISTTDFPTVGSESELHRFTIGITCTDTDTLPSLTFEGEAESAYFLAFANTGGSAEGVAVRLTRNGTTVPPGSKIPLANVSSVDQPQTFTIGSYLRRTGDMVKGTIEIPVTFTLSFE